MEGSEGLVYHLSSLGERATILTAPLRPASIHCFSQFLFFFDVVTPNLLLPWQTNERPSHVWQLISLAGGTQLDTENGGWQRSDAKREGLSCICDWGGLCESISKIIHFTVATHFSLPRPIMGLSGECDRAGCAGAQGRFCLICHQRPGDPHPLSCPLPAHTSIFPIFMDAHQSSSAAAAWIESNGRTIKSQKTGATKGGPEERRSALWTKHFQKTSPNTEIKMSREPRMEIPVGTGL